jgi:hypothetical protein
VAQGMFGNLIVQAVENHQNDFVGHDSIPAGKGAGRPAPFRLLHFDDDVFLPELRHVVWCPVFVELRLQSEGGQ